MKVVQKVPQNTWEAVYRVYMNEKRLKAEWSRTRLEFQKIRIERALKDAVKCMVL